MRQDINMNPQYGEINLNRQITSKRIDSFRHIGKIQGQDENYTYGEIIIPRYISSKNGSIFNVIIPYIPVYKPLKIRLKIDSEQEELFLLNPNNNDIWFEIRDANSTSLPLCAYRNLNENQHFTLEQTNRGMILYSMYDSDLVVKPSLSQEKIFLLKANTTNLFQYPTTGVGLISYLHANFENSGLAEKLQQEFENDGLLIKNAEINSQTGELYLEVEENDG